MNYLFEAVHAARSLAFPAVSTSVITSTPVRAWCVFRNEIIPLASPNAPRLRHDLFPNYEDPPTEGTTETIYIPERQKDTKGFGSVGNFVSFFCKRFNN